MHPQAEKASSSTMLVTMGLSRETATRPATKSTRDENRAVNFHLTQELGVDPEDKPSPTWRPVSSFVMFAIGASSR